MLRNRLFKTLSACALILLIAACASPSPNLIRRPEGPINPATEGVLAWKVFNDARGGLLGVGGGHRSAIIGVHKEGGQQHFYAIGSPKKPAARVLPPGSYRFKFFTNSLLTLRISEPISQAPFNPDFDIPIKPFTVKRGEVVYTGTLIVHGLRHDEFILRPDAPRITYEVIDESEEMRAFLEKEHPEYAEKMVTRLFEIVGEANIHKPEKE